MKDVHPWYRFPSVLIKKPLEFFPARGMTPAERLNSIIRFVVYAAAAIAYYRADWMVFGLGMCVIFVLSIVFAVPCTTPECKQRQKDPSDRETCTKPNEDNPFMNVLAHEYGINKPPACPTTTTIMCESNKHFDKGLPREISDVYHNRASDRQFVTMPVTGNNGTPDTLAFRNYLFSETAKGPKCK
jgi:hypothetical protein